MGACNYGFHTWRLRGKLRGGRTFPADGCLRWDGWLLGPQKHRMSPETCGAFVSRQLWDCRWHAAWLAAADRHPSPLQAIA